MLVACKKDLRYDQRTIEELRRINQTPISPERVSRRDTVTATEKLQTATAQEAAPTFECMLTPLSLSLLCPLCVCVCVFFYPGCGGGSSYQGQRLPGVLGQDRRGCPRSVRECDQGISPSQAEAWTPNQELLDFVKRLSSISLKVVHTRTAHLYSSISTLHTYCRLFLTNNY